MLVYLHQLFSAFNLDSLIVFLYFSITAIIGYLGIKRPKNMSEYSIGSTTKFTLIATVTATSFGAGSIVGDISNIARNGIVFALMVTNFWVFCLYAGKFIAPKFDARFKGMLSASDIIKKFYGSGAEKVSSVVGFLSSAVIVAAQASGLSYSCTHIIGYSYEITVIIFMALISLYSFLRGVNAVIKTDVLQFFIIIIAVPVMCVSLLKEAGGLSVVIKSIPSSHLEIFSHERFAEYLLLFLVGLFPFLWITPPLIQRFLMARSPGEISNLFNIQFLIRFLILLFVIFMAFSAMKIFPGAEPNTFLSKILQEAIYPGFGGIILICILSASMSTADSCINTASVLIANNLFKAKSDRLQLLIARYSVLIVGIIATLFALKKFNLFKLSFFAFSFWGSCVSVPLLGGVMGYLDPKPSNFWSCFAFSFSAVLCSLYNLGTQSTILTFFTVLAGIIGYCLPSLYKKLFRIIKQL